MLNGSSLQHWWRFSEKGKHHSCAHIPYSILFYHIESYCNRFKLKIKAISGCRRKDLQEYMDEVMCLWIYEFIRSRSQSSLMHNITNVILCEKFFFYESDLLKTSETFHRSIQNFKGFQFLLHCCFVFMSLILLLLLLSLLFCTKKLVFWKQYLQC